MAEKTAHYDNVFLTCGAHPLNQEDEIIPEQLLALSQNERVIAIGETGLDIITLLKLKSYNLIHLKSIFT